MDDTNPFAQQTFQEQPTFSTADNPASDQPNAEPVSPKRKSRRASRSATSSPAAPTPKRKYTRRKKVGAEMVGVEFGSDSKPRKIGSVEAAAPPIDREFESELDLVMEVVTKLRGYDAKTRARVMVAIGKLL